MGENLLFLIVQFKKIEILFLNLTKFGGGGQNDKPNNEIIVNIAGRSAELNAINQLLNDGGKMADIKMTETVIIRD